jgi:putative endonuclease
MYFVYLLKSIKDNNLYIGRTSNLKQRPLEYNSKKSFTTKGREPFKLIYFEGYTHENDAKQREKNLKYHG